MDIKESNHNPIMLRPLPESFKSEIIAIASSTGGPKAIIELFKSFSKEFLATHRFIINHHINKNFIYQLVDSIEQNCDILCKIAQDNEEFKQNIIYFAPSEHHIEIFANKNKLFISLNNDSPVNFCRPSADPLLISLSKLDKHYSIAIILTGIGNDGLEGAKALVSNSGIVFAQDEASSVVWGMPGAVAKAGICSAVLPVHQIAALIETRLQ